MVFDFERAANSRGNRIRATIKWETRLANTPAVKASVRVVREGPKARRTSYMEGYKVVGGVRLDHPLWIRYLFEAEMLQGVLT